MEMDGDEEKPPLHVFFDIKAMQDTKTHVANLVVAETEEDDPPVRFKGETYMTDFLEWLDTLEAGDTRDVTAIAHNFQGYDGYFVIDEYHRQNRIVEQVRNGGKIMQLNSEFPTPTTRWRGTMKPPNRVRISRMFLSRVSQMLSKQN